MDSFHRIASPVMLAALIAVPFAVGACASHPEPVLAPVAVQGGGANSSAMQAQAAPAPRADVATPTSGSISIEERILRACGNIPEAHFAFDSARLEPNADASLTALARCFLTGPLAGKAMRLVGHADPRGETEYNLGLGQRRAGSVAAFVRDRGVPAARLSSTSRGSFDAVGTDELGWAKDRRVDVLLAE